MKISDFYEFPENRRAFYRLAAEYGKGDGETRTGNPKQLLNRAIRLELLGGEDVLDLIGEMVNVINDLKTPEETLVFARKTLEVLKKVKNEMVVEILRRYKKVPGEELLIDLFHKLESLDQTNDKVRFVRDEVYSALQDMVS